MEETQSKTRKYLNISKIIKISLLILVILLLGSYLASQANNTYHKISANWNEIQFAYNHPNLVANIREDYNNKTAQLEESYKKKEPSEQEKLIEELTKQLKSSK